jgi:hypothetical protein
LTQLNCWLASLNQGLQPSKWRSFLYGPVRALNDWVKEHKTMLWTLAVILLVLWMLGMVTSYTAGGLLHILLVVAVVVVLIRIIQGRRIA